MIVGIDDTDSIKGGCTTHVAAQITNNINITNLRLIRLNPNIPYKTRGNAAISFNTRDTKQNREKITWIVKQLSRVKEGAQPGVVFLETKSKKNLSRLNNFYKKTLSSHVTKKEALALADEVGATVFKLNGGRGVIGALAAAGAKLPDKTFELIAYRDKKNLGSKRKISSGSVFAMNREFYPHVFDSLDTETKQILITPRGRDPIYCGIRGESRQFVLRAWNKIKPLEEITDVKIFETNQATDAHLLKKKINRLKPYDCATVDGVVVSEPKTISGGHVFFKLDDGSSVIDCGAYKPTGCFRNTIRKLVLGDNVRACGGVGKYAGTLNLEKIHVKKTSRVLDSKAPKCCGKKMTSAGANKGFKCRACGKRKPEFSLKKTPRERELSVGWYEVPPRARRHLSKPLARR